MRRRRALLAAGAALVAPLAAAAADAFEGDPYQSHPWPDMRREFLGGERAVFDERVQVQGPGFAEDPMNVPVTVSVRGLGGVQRIVVLVDRNPIRKVLEYSPVAALPAVSFRFKLEQASPVRAAARTADGVWHVGGTWVDSAGGGCTVSGVSRKDGTWASTLGRTQSRLFSSSPMPDAAARLRLRVLHPMDTGLVAGIPAFYLNRLSVRDAQDRELLRLLSFEPVSENPVFSFDFARKPQGPLKLVASDNNGNRITSVIE